jgi:flagellar basal-body rod protein FlgF
MIYGLYLSAAGLQSNSYELDVIANNLANADTVGFKRDLAVLTERRVEADESGRLGRRNDLLDKLSGGTAVSPTYTTFTNGALEETGRPLDLAISGEGFFEILEGDEVYYSRDGRMMTDVQGRLTTVTGKSVLDANGQPIVIDPRSAEPVSVSPEGVLRQGQNEVARLGLVAFDDTRELTKVGGGLFKAHGETPRPATGGIVAGYLEQSTVDPVTTLARMIEAQRAYQMNATMISLQDGMLSRAVNDLGKVT